MAFVWPAVDGPLIVVFGSFLPSSNKKTKTKKPVKVGPPLTKLSGSAHGYLNYSATVLEMQVKGAHLWMLMKVKKDLLIHNDKRSFADSDKILNRDKHNEGANILQQ